MNIVSRIDFSMVQVLLGRVERVDTNKLFQIETYENNLSPNRNQTVEINEINDKQESSVSSIEFEAAVEIIDPVKHVEQDVNAPLMETPVISSINDPTQENVNSARERFLARKRLKKE
jgi:hypothetical protein